MNTSWKIGALSLTTLILATGNAQAQTPGEGGRDIGNGGSSVRVRGVNRLRDLVDTAVCERGWISATDWGAEQPEYATVLESIRSVHWYFAAELEHEARNVTICELSVRLPYVPTEEMDLAGMTVYETGTPTRGRRNQTAIRIGNRVLLDVRPRQGFPSMPDHDRAFLVLHELAHSFLANNVPGRNGKIMNFVHGMEIHHATPMTTERFALQISANGLDLVADVSGWSRLQVALPAFVRSPGPETARALWRSTQ